MTTQRTQKDSYKNARSIFLNSMVDTSPTKAGAEISTPEKFKHKVNLPGVIHTTGRTILVVEL